MSFKRFLLALAFAAGLGVPAEAAPLAAYGNLPSIQSVEISPDGAMLAMIVSQGERRTLAIRPLAGGDAKYYDVGDAKVRNLDWVGSDYLIISASQTAAMNFQMPGAGTVQGAKQEYTRAFALNLKTQRLQPLLDRSPGRQQTGTHFRDPTTAAIWASMNVLAAPPQVRDVKGVPTLFLQGISYANSYAVLTVIQVDLKSDGQRVIELGDNRTNRILLGDDGAPVAKSGYDPTDGHWTLKLRRSGGAWAEVRTVQAKTERPSLVGLGRDGQSVVIAEQGEQGDVLREVSADGVVGEPLNVRDVDGLIFDPDTHRMIGVSTLVGDDLRYSFFAPNDQKAWDAVRGAFKGDRVKLASWSKDRRKIVVLADSATEGLGYAVVDLATRKAEWLGSPYDQLTADDIAEVRPVRFKAKDGLELSGYLTLPRGKSARDLPLVVLPHGGPASRDEPGFDWWPQAIASRGYAVLQVNFRGSDGFGWSFTRAGFGEWGRKMQTDLSDGVRDLAAQGVIDPKRVCIVGASYGGYAALAGAALDTGVYRCAASVSGPSDLPRFVDWSRERKGVESFRYWTRFMGGDTGGDAALREISPAAHADRISIPVLLVHGRDDTVVPLEQSQIMADAMKRAGKPVELVIQKGEDHWLSRGDTRLEMLTTTMAFVEKHNPPN